MKTTIRGVRYDSDRAILVGTHAHCPAVPTDPSHWQATLYRQLRSGRYFLGGHGGYMTAFAGRERIIPLFTHDAAAWSERYCGGKL